MRSVVGRHPRFSALVLIALLGAAGLVAVLALSRSTARAGHLLAEVCRPGTAPADNPAADANTGDRGDRSSAGQDHRAVKCARMGGPESFQDFSTANSELGARENAPFASAAAGAYINAYRQRQALLAAGTVPGAGARWALAGKPPECAAPTSGSSVCPQPNADNGNYAYMSTLGFRTLSGRISSLAYDPGTTGRYFASPVVGGVWETRDAGKNWRSIGDPLPTQAVGAIAYDAPLHRVIAASGDNSFGGSGIAGHGVYYTDNDGASWKTGRGIPDQILSFKVAVSPADHTGRTVYVATSKGLFSSTDGGATWVNDRLPTSPKGYSPDCAGNTTNRLCFFANEVTDVIVKPTATANAPAGAVIAAVGWRAGPKQNVDGNGNPEPGCTMNGSATPCLQAPQNGLYESNSGTPGSFKFSDPSATGFAPTNVAGRTALDVAHGAGQSSDAIYALVEDTSLFNHCPDILDQPTPPPTCDATVTGEAIATVLKGMYASYDFGKTWTQVMDQSQLKEPGTNSSLLGQPGYGPGVQAWYNLWVEADPTATDPTSHDPTRVVFGLEEIWENSPGAVANPLTTPFAAQGLDPWVVIGRYWNACGAVNTPTGPCNPNPFTSGPIAGTTTHPDQHAHALIPDGKGGVTLLAGSDGGAFSQHAAAGASFSNDNWGDGLNGTISAVQPYDAEMAKDGTIVSGLQDNGELKIAPNGHEAEIYGGDAFFNTIDPNNSKNIIEEYTYANQVNLTRDGGASWYAIQPSACGAATNALFSTPIEQDPTMDGHVLIGCTQIQEGTNVYANPCAAPPGATAGNCQASNVPFNTVYDLSTLPAPSGASNIPSALAVQGADEYVGYCGYCDPATQSLPFDNGIATNVGGSAKPQIGTSNGWHKASAFCSGCGTADGRLPRRYINSIQEDPSDPNTVYVTLGGYGRRWIPPGSFGESTANVGVGHVFVSHDHGEHFTNITGNLPDISANWTLVHAGRLIVGTDLGVFIARSTGSHPSSYAVLGTGLPAAPVFTIRQSPADANLLLISTYGRGDWLYHFPKVPPPPRLRCPAPSGSLSGTRLGPLALGFTRAHARAVLTHHRLMNDGFDDFCLNGGPGIRVGYPTTRELRSLSPSLRRSVSGRIVVALSANRRYALRGVHPGATLASARRSLHLGSGIHVGQNYWFLVGGRAANYLLKVRGGVVREVGVVDKRLTGSRAAAQRFLNSYSYI